MSSNSDWQPEDLATFRVMVRDDFQLAVSRFLWQMEIPLLEGDNSALPDLFVLEHARNLLAASGRLNRVSKTGFGASLEATSTCLRLHFDPEVAIRAVNFRQTVTNSGLLVLRELRRRKFCSQVCKINRILTMAAMARKCTLLAINLITPAGLSPHRSTLGSMTTDAG